MPPSTTKIHVPAVPGERAVQAGPVVSWIIRPTRDVPRAATISLLVLVGGFVLVLATTGKVYLGLLAVVAGAICCWRNFVPTTYEMNESGLSRSAWRHFRETKWSSIRGLQLEDDGLILLPEPRFGALEMLRGIYVPWGTHRDEVIGCVECYAPYLLPHESDDTAEEPPAAAEPPATLLPLPTAQADTQQPEDSSSQRP